MFTRIAQRAQRRAERTGKLKHIKRAWFWRSLAQWLRGGDWSPFPEHVGRQSNPRTSTTIRFLAPGAPPAFEHGER